MVLSPLLYKYLPPSVGEKFLSRGLSYSRPVDFFDENEFRTQFVPVRERELLAVAEECSANRKTQEWLASLSEAERSLCEFSAQIIQQMSRKKRRLYLGRRNALLRNVTPYKLKSQLSSICRVCSLTTWENSEMMWKEYAQDSTGVKLSFKKDILSKPEFGTLRPVTYSSKLPPYNPSYCTPHGEHLMRIIFSKLDSYVQEREVRLCVNLWVPQYSLYQNLYEKEILMVTGVQREYSYYRPIQYCLSSITFGGNSSNETKKRICTLLYQNPNAEYCIKLGENLHSTLRRLDSDPNFKTSTVDDLVERLSKPIRRDSESHLKDCSTVWALLNLLKTQLAPVDDNLLLDVLLSNEWLSQIRLWSNIPRFHDVRVYGT